MSNLKIPDRIRLQLAAVESPTTFQGIQPGVGLSPVTDLALNLSGASLGSTPRGRRLSLSSLENTPTPSLSSSLQSDFADTDSSATDSRLFKNSIKLNSNASNQSRARGFSRRINLNLPASPYEKSNTPHNDKENMGCDGPPVGLPQTDANSFTQRSPSKQIISPSKYKGSPLRRRQPLEDQDPNSQDSGYGPFLDKDETKLGFRFAEPNGLAPRKHNSEQSPKKENSPTNSPGNKGSGHSNPPLFHSLSSGSESIDDGFTDLLDLDKMEENVQLPSGISSLLSGPIIRNHNAISNPCPKEERPRSTLQRSLSLVENLTPTSSRARNCLFSQSGSTYTQDCDDTSGLVAFESLRSFKRPEPPCEIAPLQSKRRKSSSLHSIRENNISSGPPSFQRSFSETEATIKRALQRSTQIPDLIGDFSKPFILPLMEGRHQDLKTICPDTLAHLMNGEYNDEIESYTVIDCRYPYEYEGGHIKGAKNIYTKEQILREFVEVQQSVPATDGKVVPKKSEDASGSKRNILIFHCEFSSERGPSLFRFLRNSDRDQNKESYPTLNYPELYLLHGGYKSFFERHCDKCEPCAYRPMLDPNHETDLRLFRSKSKSWNGDSKSRLALRNSLKRLGL